MCGILAIARVRPSREPLIGERELSTAVRRLAGRGPDGGGVYDSPCARVLLAHTRLAILDRSEAGRQPMADRPAALRGTAARGACGSSGGADREDASEPLVVVTFNGEIYNAPALKRELESLGDRFASRTDTEVIVHGYKRWGIAGLLERLIGMFAFVVLDRRGSAVEIHAAVDPAGMKPLCWAFDPARDGGTLLLASDADALRGALPPDRRPGLDPAGLERVLTVGYAPAPGTVWRGVRKLAPGHALSWSLGETRPRVWRHWSPPEALRAGAQDPAAEQEAFESLLERVIADHLLSDVPVGLFLSAGLDSSSIALALARSGRAREVTAYTLATDTPTDEAAAAGELARLLGMRHRVIRFEPAGLPEALRLAAAAYDEPQGFTALLTAARIAWETRFGDDGPTVVLAGDGGDEALAGYAWHRDDGHALSLAAPEASSEAFASRYVRRVFPGFSPAEARAVLGGAGGEAPETPGAWLAAEDRPCLPHPRRAQRLDAMGFCAGSILPKIDRASMAVGLEMRAPFLDRRVLGWSLARPVNPDETRAATSKPLLRAYLARGVADGLVPAEILTRPKQGFSLRLPDRRPFESLRPWLDSSRLIRDGVIDRGHARFLPPDAETREVRLFTLCMLAAWYEHRF